MRAIFSEMARHNFQHSDFTAMMRNKFHLKFRDHSISSELGAFLKSRRQLAEDVLNADRLIVVFSLLSHKGRFSLTYDNLLFLINRIEMMDPEMKKREPEDIKAMLDAYLRSYLTRSGFCVCRHIVRSFHRVLIVRLLFLHDMIQDGFHIGTRIGIIVRSASLP